MANRKRSLRRWWTVLFILFAAGAFYAAIIAFKWDLFMKEVGALEPQEFSQKDILQCEPGTHQQNGMCVSNPESAHPQGPAPAPPKSAKK